VVAGGPHFPVRAATSRPRPATGGSPLLAFDLTAGQELPTFAAGAADLVVLPLPADPASCRLERV
jgi:hypothetical protein